MEARRAEIARLDRLRSTSVALSHHNQHRTFAGPFSRTFAADERIAAPVTTCVFGFEAKHYPVRCSRLLDLRLGDRRNVECLPSGSRLETKLLCRLVGGLRLLRPRSLLIEILLEFVRA